MIFVSPAKALRVNFKSQGDSDKLTFAFDSGKLVDASVARRGAEELVVTLPDGVWDSEPKPTVKDFPGKLVKSISVEGNTIRLTTRTNAFGYMRLPVPGKSEFLLQLFRDPVGARWKPASAAPKPKPAPKPKAATKPVGKTSPKPKAKAQTPVAPAPEPDSAIPKAAEVAQALNAVTPETSSAAPQQGAAPQGEDDLPPEPQKTDHKPFFAVPYSVREEVEPPAEAEASPQAPVVPHEVETGDYPPASELRFKAVDKTAEQVKFAELAGDGGGSASVVPSGQQQDETRPNQVGGAVAPPPNEVSGQGQAGGAVAPPESVSGAGSVSSSVSPPPAEMSGQGQVGGVVAPPPSEELPTGQGQVSGAVAPPPNETEVAEEGASAPAPVAAPVVDQEVADEAAQIAAAQKAAREAAEEPQTTEGDEAAAPYEEGAQVEKQKTPVELAAEREEELRNKLYEAQSLMFNGSLEEALPLYEDVLKQPTVPDDVREEALFAIADIKKQIFSTDLDGNFDDIAQAYIEAMNADLQSTRVPRALLNLGLLNLQVGNFPEARAYFKILQEKYPDDENIPSISYYWGEYFYKKGDFKKAADQFQYLIQTYPEHQLVKQASFYLADSLNRTGFLDQAFQIVDYIDKRWPDYYMENMKFLELAGSIEMKLKKWDAAKDHYFTYYNLNPENDDADIVLARIGDIYIRKGQKQPAKQIYEKVVSNYPDQEGALIAKMRLAEEGIYDEPAMHEMVDIFDRPYNLNPQKVYSEIVSKHPDSPLAPIAQLKLAMWYAFNKKYPEALTAAQDFIENYPDSPLLDKAKALGDSVFAQAVPGMIGEERYGRVVRYWETYDFIGKEGSKVDDKTKLAIATSYWKVGQPEKALALLKPYLTEKQLPGVSDKALGLAVNIYLDQLAWKDIADLVAMTKKHWKLAPAQQRQLDYARAMSLQNLGDSLQAVPMWAELAKDQSVDPAFRAYAMYYMAKDAMERQDLRRVFVYSQEALALLLQTKGDPEKIKDTVLMSIYATERSGRYDEALKWAKEYDKYIEVDNPEWASTRFKLARIYRKAGAMEEWKQLLSDIIEKKPESLQAQLAKSALETYELEQQASEYAPNPG
ncbi:hypothetical protein PSDVSF_00360 [Pseudodesulfovibrio sediminis]|uniref:Tetratricopeptide repeat protein n=1 Tax=Pseudodesulfovibrio sediminis TaxID=2810563 RepID=A0ABM7P1Y8_9BACT|nr:hypothetical protein PSDVSF_00360 [Pseudodesulfovibrio sediminis]